MKLLGKVFISCILGGIFFGSLFAASWGDFDIKAGNSKFAEDLIDRIVGEEKKDTGIIQTDLDKVDKNEGAFEEQLKISNTLDSTRYKLEAYLQWFAFIGLSAAVVLIVYNGLMLVFSPLSPDQIASVRKRLMYVVLGALVIVGFYFVMKVLLSVLVQIVIR